MTDFARPTHIQDEVLDFLLTAPSPQDIIKFHASEQAQERLRYLLDANRNGTLTEAETTELNEAQYANHMVIMLKAKARKAIQSQ